MNERWEPFDEHGADASPFVQFRAWFDEARSVMADRETVALATSTPDGHPSARMVLLRHVDERTLGWYTNYQSRKGRELEANAHAALLWYCEPLGRQVRVEGLVATMSAERSDAYFAQRARGHQIGAYASAQSAIIPDRAFLEHAVEHAEREFAGLDVPRPPYWGGYEMAPSTFEFFQQRHDRLHDRVLYTREHDDWVRARQSP